MGTEHSNINNDYLSIYPSKKELIKKKALWLGFSLIALICGAIFTDVFNTSKDFVMEKGKLYYSVTRRSRAVVMAQNIEKLAKIIVDGKEVENLSYVDIELFNYSPSNYGQLEIEVCPVVTTPRLLHKVVLYNDTLEANWIKISTDEANKIYVFIQKLSPSEPFTPNVMVRLFYDAADVHMFDYVLKSPSCEIELKKMPVPPAPFLSTLFYFFITSLIIMIGFIAWMFYSYLFVSGKYSRLCKLAMQDAAEICFPNQVKTQAIIRYLGIIAISSVEKNFFWWNPFEVKRELEMQIDSLRKDVNKKRRIQK